MLAAMQIRFLGLAGVGLISVGYYSLFIMIAYTMESNSHFKYILARLILNFLVTEQPV
jgi:hypothetical protein